MGHATIIGGPTFNLVRGVAPVRLQTFAVATITALVDADVRISGVVHVDSICSAVTVDVDEMGSGWVEGGIKVEGGIDVVHEHALEDRLVSIFH